MRRTSSQLRKVDRCEFNPNANVYLESNEIRNVRIQKNIIKRALMGEPIDNYQIELANLFDKASATWENNAQRNNTLNAYGNRIARFVRFENNNPDRQTKYFRGEYDSDGPLVVDYFGEPVEAIPDYVVEDDDTIRMCKVKTGRYTSNTKENVFSQEGYCLGLAGEQLAKKFAERDGRETPKKVVVEYLYLGDAAPRTEESSMFRLEDGSYMVPYDSTDPGFEHIVSEEFGRYAKESAKEDHDLMMEDKSGCSPEECASCSHNNICNFVEPPTPAPPAAAVIREINLDPSNEQAPAIDFEEGIARVNAGPGSGKTFTVGSRIAKLVEKGYDSNKICVLTFTNAGAAEMTERAMRIAAKKGVPLDPEHITSKTINAFCQDIICEHYGELGYTRKPSVVKDSDKRAILNRILDQFPRMSKWTYPSNDDASVRVYNRENSMLSFVRIEDEFAAIKKENYTRENYPEHWDKRYTPRELDMLFLMYGEFQRQLKLKNRLEFDDQLRLVNVLYEQDPDLFNKMGYEHIVVDEFQDTDLPQIKLLQKMCDTTSFKSFMAVGDDSQSIFRFRHTSPEYMINFGNYFGQDFEKFELVENHRSHRFTVDFANKIVNRCDNKVDKELSALREEGTKPSVKGFYSQATEFDWIAKEVAERWNAGKRDIAVIMSDGPQLTAFADALSKYGIPSTVKSPIPVMSNSRVRALLTFYDSFMGKGTQGLLDYQNAASHGSLKGKNAAELEAIAEEFKADLSECKRDLKTFIGFAEALDAEGNDECYQDFITGFKEAQDMTELCEFMEDFKLYGAASKFKREGRYDGVCLTTIHSSKGLEWDTTFLCLDKLDKVDYHNHPTKYRQNGEYDEQLRKMFVGCTRAKEELIMTGQYVLMMNEKKDIMLSNDFLKYAYEFCDKAWDYEYTEYRAVVESEKEAKKSVREILTKDGIPTLGDKTVSIIEKHASQSKPTAAAKAEIATAMARRNEEQNQSSVERE